MSKKCCDQHSWRCERFNPWVRPYGGFCCHRCSEIAHPQHLDGSTCANPDPAWLNCAYSQ